MADLHLRPDGPSRETMKRWRDRSLFQARRFSLGEPLPDELDVRVTVAHLCAYIQALTIEVCEPDEADRYWGNDAR